jgi:hypothetical protein
LSGSDDGSIELWGAVRKKPIHILRNAHALLTDSKKSDQKDSEILPNGNLGKPLNTVLIVPSEIYLCVLYFLILCLLFSICVLFPQ